MAFIFSLIGVFQSIEIIEISTKLLENILRKIDMNWEMLLNRFTGNLNSHII